MTTTRFEVITGGGGNRRRWSREEKERLVAASLEPGVTASQIARSAGIHTSQLFSLAKATLRDVGVDPHPDPDGGVGCGDCRRHGADIRTTARLIIGAKDPTASCVGSH